MITKRTALSAIAALGSATLLLTGCSTANKTTEATATDDCPVDEFAMALRWQQQAAEAHALQQQTFTNAAHTLKELLKEHETSGSDLPPAIITDIDETLIDNSKLLARDLQDCHDYSDWDTWQDWEREGHPTALPGALDFLQTADELGIRIHYISDRYEENFDNTLATLRELNFPQLEGDTDNLMLLGPPKEDRRNAVQNTHDVLMQLGDTMHDFHPDFADASLEKQHQLLKDNAEKVGREWIILPNPTYGSWQKAELETWEDSEN